MMDGAAELGVRVREVLPENYRPDRTLEQSILDLDGHTGQDGCICDVLAEDFKVNPACRVRGMRLHNGRGQCTCSVVGSEVQVNPACRVQGLRVLEDWDLKTPEDTDYFETWEQLMQHAKLFVQVSTS
jgi:hypothetical protein